MFQSGQWTGSWEDLVIQGRMFKETGRFLDFHKQAASKNDFLDPYAGHYSRYLIRKNVFKEIPMKGNDSETIQLCHISNIIKLSLFFILFTIKF